MPPQPSPFGELLAGLARAFERLGLRWYVFGAQAALVHGAARLTADVDVTVDLGDTLVQRLVSELGAEGFDLRVSDVDGFVERTRVIPVAHRPTSIAADIVLAGPGIVGCSGGRPILRGTRVLSGSSSPNGNRY